MTRLWYELWLLPKSCATAVMPAKNCFLRAFFLCAWNGSVVGVDVMLQPTGWVYPGLCLHRADTASACVSRAAALPWD